MRFSLLLSQLFAASTTLYVSTLAQTSTTCNPLHQTCPSDPALGKSISIDFTQGPSDQFTASGGGAPTYDSNGVSLTVAKSGDSPTLTSKWYIMFGHVDIVMQAAPGVGIVSTMDMISDDLDEVDYEWLGADGAHVQSNYFVKGNTATYDRGETHSNPGNQGSFQTYSFDWTADAIVWSINGQAVRTLSSNDAPEGFPQTPMQVKVGVWSAGDPSNAPGTIAWAGGPTNYGAGPYTALVKSMVVTDYSTGTSYSYGDESGTWQSIKSDGGSINSNGSPGASSGGSASQSASDPSTTATFDGTHKDTTTTFTPTGYPWTPTTMATGTVSTTIPGLPNGQSVSASGTVVAPSAASSATLLSSSTPSSPALAAATPSAPAINQGANISASSSLATFTASGASGTFHLMKGLGLACALFGGALLF